MVATEVRIPNHRQQRYKSLHHRLLAIKCVARHQMRGMHGGQASRTGPYARDVYFGLFTI